MSFSLLFPPRKENTAPGLDWTLSSHFLRLVKKSLLMLWQWEAFRKMNVEIIIWVRERSRIWLTVFSVLRFLSPSHNEQNQEFKLRCWENIWAVLMVPGPRWIVEPVWPPTADGRGRDGARTQVNRPHGLCSFVLFNMALNLHCGQAGWFSCCHITPDFVSLERMLRSSREVCLCVCDQTL